MKQFLAKYSLLLLLAVMLTTAAWQYWQIQKHAPVQASPYQGCGVSVPDNKENCLKCGWAWENNTCCPSDKSACKKVGEYECTNKPQKFQCTYYSRYCRNPNYWRIVQTYSSVEEMCKDKDCKCEKPKLSPTPRPSLSPSPSPSLSPSPSPSLVPQTGRFRVSKFNDRNRNGQKDWNEVSTGVTWPFQYRVANNAWVNYSTDKFTGLGGFVTVPAGSQVIVKELFLAGWHNSTPLQKSETVSANETQWFEFGNYRLTSPSPSPSASPSLSPSPSPSPWTEQGWIRVRKFNDRNKNGVKDWNEVSTGRNWPFKYKIANGPWQDYTTNAFTGVGPAVKVPANSQITVKEIVLGGWVNSTAIKVSELVTNNEVQWFTFGNYRTSGPEPSPSVSPSPSPSATPVPTPEPDEASFVIRKFKDDDKDGYWDNNETATGQYWQFYYRLNSDDWQSYQTDPSSGWGGLVTVGLDTKIEVKEETVNGWVNTTGLTQIKILDESKVYYFDFGNFAEPETVEASVPPTIPAAGIAFSLWPLGVAAAAGIALQLLALLL